MKDKTSKKKATKATKKETPKTPLLAGMVFTKSDSIYDKQLILSDKKYELRVGVYRECVAWNDERCRRYDATEDEIYKEEQIGVMDSAALAEYIQKNKKDEWNIPDIPKYKEIE